MSASLKQKIAEINTLLNNCRERANLRAAVSPIEILARVNDQKMEVLARELSAEQKQANAEFVAQIFGTVDVNNFNLDDYNYLLLRNLAWQLEDSFNIAADDVVDFLACEPDTFSEVNFKGKKYSKTEIDKAIQAARDATGLEIADRRHEKAKKQYEVLLQGEADSQAFDLYNYFVKEGVGVALKLYQLLMEEDPDFSNFDATEIDSLLNILERYERVFDSSYKGLEQRQREEQEKQEKAEQQRRIQQEQARIQQEEREQEQKQQQELARQQAAEAKRLEDATLVMTRLFTILERRKEFFAGLLTAISAEQKNGVIDTSGINAIILNENATPKDKACFDLAKEIIQLCNSNTITRDFFLQDLLNCANQQELEQRQMAFATAFERMVQNNLDTTRFILGIFEEFDKKMNALEKQEQSLEKAQGGAAPQAPSSVSASSVSSEVKADEKWGGIPQATSSGGESLEGLEQLAQEEQPQQEEVEPQQEEELPQQEEVDQQGNPADQLQNSTAKIKGLLPPIEYAYQGSVTVTPVMPEIHPNPLSPHPQVTAVVKELNIPKNRAEVIEKIAKAAERYQKIPEWWKLHRDKDRESLKHTALLLLIDEVIKHPEQSIADSISAVEKRVNEKYNSTYPSGEPLPKGKTAWQEVLESTEKVLGRDVTWLTGHGRIKRLVDEIQKEDKQSTVVFTPSPN